MTRSRCVREPLRKIFGSNIYEAQTSLHLVDYKKKVGGEAKKSENRSFEWSNATANQALQPQHVFRAKITPSALGSMLSSFLHNYLQLWQVKFQLGVC